MLVLSRRTNEAIYLERGDEVIKVTLVRISVDRVRLGFDAPADWNIRRGELKPREISERRESMPAVVPEIVPQ